MAYATIYKLHKSFTEALISQRKMERLTSDRKPLAAAITYTGLMQIPLGHWAVTKIIDTENYDVKDIPSHPLHRSELEKLGGPSGNLEKCPNPFVQLWLHPSLVLPQVFIEFEDFNQGDLTCSLSTSPTASIAASTVKSKRSIENENQ